jgi:photosystem II stability/assembly factor-like uncharacterized protein
MALTQEDLAALAGFIGSEVEKHLQASKPAEPTPEEKAQTAANEQRLKAGVPDVDPEAGPEYYVHLANGDVITTKDSGSTHMSVDGETIAVIGRYQVHPKTGEV